MQGMRFARRRVLGGGLTLGAGLALPSSVFAQGAARRPVTVANAAGNINLVMQEVMKQQKFLEEFGLEPNVMNVADGSKMMGGVLGGDIELSTMSGFGQIFPAIERGGKLKVIAGAGLLPTLALFTSKPAVKTLKDLEGRTVGTGSLGALVHQLNVALLRKGGVDVSKVRFVNIGSSADVFRAAMIGTIDAGTGEVAIIDHAEKFKVRFIPGSNMSTELTEYTFQGAWTSERAMETKRDLLVRTLAAYAKLYRFVHKPEAREPFIKAYLTFLKSATQDDAEAMWAYVQRYKPYAENLVLEPERLRYMQQLNVDLEVQKTVMPFERVADMSIAREALKLL